MSNLPITPKPSQLRFQADFFSLKYKFLLFAGPVNTGKTYGIGQLLIGLLADFPGSRLGVIRKNITTAKKATLPSFIKVLDKLGVNYKVNRADMTIKIYNGDTPSEILFIEADQTKDPDFNKLKGLELSFALIEEVNEIVEYAYSVLMTRIARWNDNGVPSFIMMTCNPSQGWVKEKFYDPFMQGVLEAPYYFLQSSKEEIPKDTLEILKELPTNEYSRYVENNWTYSDDPQQLIKYEWLKANLCEESEVADKLAIDVARYGGDRTIFAYLSGTNLVKLEKFIHQDTYTTADVGILRAKEKEIGSQFITVDVVGLGAGVVDTMRAKGYYVSEFNSSSSSDQSYSTFQFKNKRAEAYWNLREKLEKGEIKLIKDDELFKELVNIRYIIKDKFIAIEEKDEIKKRLGFSPDKADACAMAFNIKSGFGEVSTGGNVFNSLKHGGYLSKMYKNATSIHSTRPFGH